VQVVRPSWGFDETRGMGEDFADPAEVAAYVRRQGVDPEAERRRVAELGIRRATR
jgi:hypothetical protein